MENQKPNKRRLIRDIVISPRAPKWRRHLLLKKEAEEYLLICRDSTYHPVIKKAKKVRYFLKWAMKLIVPDFLIGHPNLWDNLKTLRKHPQFRPLRMALIAWLIFAITFGSAGIYSLRFGNQIAYASYLPGWAKRIKLTVDGSKIDADLTHFPITVFLKAGNGETTKVFDEIGANKYKIAIADDSATPVQYYVEIEQWDAVNKVGILHFGKAGEVLPSGTDKDFYLYYDNTHADNTDYVGEEGSTPGKNVWETANVMTQHMDDNPDSSHIKDSTSYANDGLKKAANEPIEVDGEIGKAQDYDGTDDYVEVPHDSSIDPTSAWTLEAWVKRRQINVQHSILEKYNWASGKGNYGLRVASNNKISSFVISGSSVNVCGGVTNLAADIWYHVAATFDANTDTLRCYVNGALDNENTNATINPPSSSVSLKIGCRGNDCATNFNGIIDEARIYSKALSPAEIKASYHSTNDTLLTYGSEELTNEPPHQPTNVSPADSATGQDLNLTLTGSAYSDPENDPQTDAEWRVDDDSDFSSPVWTRTAGVAETTTTVNATNGTFANELAGKTELDHNTTYYWQVRYSDGQWSSWSTATNFTTNLIHAPTNISPADGATVTTLTPLLEASDFVDDDPDHTHAASQWQVDDNSDFSSVTYDSGQTASGETSHAVPSGNLSNFTTYYWRVRYKDSSGFWSEYSAPTSFEISIMATAIEVLPVFGNTTVDQGDSVNIDVQVLNFSDGSPLNNATTTINIYNPSGTKIVDGAAMTYVSGSNGIYRYSYTVPTTSGSYLYEVTATQGNKRGYGAANFEVRTIASDISSTKSTVESEQAAQSAERVAQATSRTEVTEIKKQVKAGILEAPKTAKSGNTITIKYKAESGLTGNGAPKLNVYDANNVQRVTDGAMTEIGSTGVYSASTTLEAGWGTGFFTIIVSETTNNTSDHTQVFVGSSDIESIGSDVASVKSTVESTSANVDILVGALIVTQSTVNDASPTATSFVTALTNSTDDFYKNAVLTFTSGNLNGQVRRISDYDGTTKTITLDPALTSAPANGDSFTIVKQNVRVEEQVAAHETAQASFRSDVTSRLTTLQTSVNDIYSLLQTVDNNLSSVQTTVNSIRASQQKNYRATLSDVSEIQAGKTYRAKLTILDFESNPVDASSTPTILIYDATRAVAQATTTMTKLSTGVYEYTAPVSSNATTGLWETIVNVDVGGAADIVLNDYWQVTGAPAQVVINSMSDLTVPSIAANVTITNEGGGPFEYQYEWCVVTSQTNQCGGDDDVYYGSAAKLIAAGDSFNTTLTATVPNPGDYWFKVVVYYGTAASGASRTFTAVEEGEAPTVPSGGGGGAAPSLATHENIYSEIIKARSQLDLNAQKLARTLEILGAMNPAIQSLLSINVSNTEALMDIQNKIADLRAVSAATRRIVEQRSAEPIVETYMKFNSVEIHFLITNPADSQQTVKFKSFLPEEVRPEHILDLSGLKIDYDANAKTYYVSGDITLGPKETVTRKVEIKDIWVFLPEEIASLKKQAEELLPALKKTQYEAQGVVLKNDIDQTLATVLLRQEESYSSPQDHIVVYRENKERIARARNNLEKLNDLVVQAGASRGVIGQVGGIQTFATWGIILAIVFGFGLLAAIIFAMWRYQIILAATATGVSRKEIAAHFGSAKGRRQRSPREDEMIMPRPSIAPASFIWRLPWKKILIRFVIICLIAFSGILAVKFVPGLIGPKEISFETEETPAAVESTALREKSIGLQLVQETPSKAKMSFGTESPTSNFPKVKILETPTGWLNVRDEASFSGKVFAKVYPGEEYEYKDKQNGWYQIVLKDGMTGWVYEKYVQTIED